MILKQQVKLELLQPQMVLGAMIVAGVYARYNVECVITSCNDSKHMDTSKHYKGCAMDFRTKNYLGDKQQLLKAVQEALGPNFDAVFEAPSTENEHLHVEYDPETT